MLYTLNAVKDNIRNRDGSRVFYLGKSDQLTSEARDYLNRERIAIIPAEQAKFHTYQLLNGGTLDKKPEHMTHLNGNILVPKTHPRIAFRGEMDTLESEMLLCSKHCSPDIQKKLTQGLTFARKILSWEVMNEPVQSFPLDGMDSHALRERSHRPQEFYGQPHFMPEPTDQESILRLNRCRCAARRAELAAARAFTDQDGNCTRGDLLQAMNRLSSFLYLLMIQEKAAR